MKICLNGNTFFMMKMKNGLMIMAFRTIFFCKGALETVKKFGWPPDIIHCSGWMTGLDTRYLKTIYKKEPVFSHSKVVYTIGQNTFKEKLGTRFLKKALIHPSTKRKRS